MCKEQSDTFISVVILKVKVYSDFEQKKDKEIVYREAHVKQMFYVSLKLYLLLMF